MEEEEERARKQRNGGWGSEGKEGERGRERGGNSRGKREREWMSFAIRIRVVREEAEPTPSGYLILHNPINNLPVPRLAGSHGYQRKQIPLNICGPAFDIPERRCVRGMRPAFPL